MAATGCLGSVAFAPFRSLQLQTRSSCARRELWNGTSFVASIIYTLYLYPHRIIIAHLSAFSSLQVPLSTENWVTVLTWAAPILIVDEILKAIGRRINQEDRNSEKGVKAVL